MRQAVYVVAFLVAMCLPLVDVLAQSTAPAGSSGVAAQVKALQSASGAERLAIVDALGDLGPEAASATEPLTALLADADVEIRSRAARALGAIGPGAASAISALTHAVDDPSPRVKAYALYALGMIGEKAQPSFPKIVACLTDSDVQVRREAVKAMRRLHLPLDVVAPELLRVLETAKTAEEIMPALHSMAEVGKAGVPRMIEALKRPDTRFWVCRILAEMGPDARDAVAAVTEALADERPEVRREAAICLGRIGADAGSAAPQLAKLVQDKDAGARAAALWALSMVGAPAAEISGYAKSLLSDSDEMVRIVAHWAATKHDPQNTELRATAVDLLINALKNENPRMRAVAAQGLVDLQTGDPRVIEAFIEALSRGDEAVVEAAGDALMDQRGKAVPRLVKALGRPSLRGFALAVLSRIGPAAKDAVKPVSALLTDEDPRIRAGALVTLRSIAPDDAEAVGTIASALADKNSDVRLAAVEMLDSAGAAGAARPALEKLVDDPNPTVREAVRFVLGKKKPQ